MQVIDGALRVARGGEDDAVVVLQDPKPVGYVGGVVLARLECQVQVGTKKRRAQFGDEFLDN